MGTHGYCTVRLRTKGLFFFLPATTLPPYSSSKNETNCVQQRGKSNWKSGKTYQSRKNTSSVWLKGPHLTHSANADNLKGSNHSARSPKRKLDELLELFDDTASSQRPDGPIEDIQLKHLFMIEVACTNDSPDSLLRAHVKNMCKYNPLLHAFPQHVAKQQSYIMGIQGSINEQQWRQQLRELGMDSHQQDKTMQKYLAASIRGTHRVASSFEKQDNDGWLG